MKKVLISILLLFCSSCSPINTNSPPIGTPPHTLTPLSETPTQTPVQMDTPTPTAPAPKVQKICPCDRNVTFGDKDFLSTSQLIIKKGDAWGLMDLSNGKIQRKALVDYNFGNFDASPDHHSFAYMENLDAMKRLWVFTPAATHSYQLPSNSDKIVWLNNEDIAIWDFRRWQCTSLVAFINTVTGKITHPTHYPDLSKTYCEQDPVINAQKSEIAYTWSKYNLVNGTSATLLGFPRMNLGGVSPLDMAWVGDKLAIAYWYSDYLLYGMSLPDSTNTDQSVNFQIVKIPLPKLASSEDVWWGSIVKFHQSEQSAIIGMDLIDKSTNPVKRPVHTNFYTIDTAQQQITDYELDRSVFSKTKSGTVIFNYVSPDERFLAWPIYKYPAPTADQSQIIGSLILDLKSGKVLAIPDVEVLGWFAP